MAKLYNLLMSYTNMSSYLVWNKNKVNDGLGEKNTLWWPMNYTVVSFFQGPVLIFPVLSELYIMASCTFPLRIPLWFVVLNGNDCVRGCISKWAGWCTVSLSGILAQLYITVLASLLSGWLTVGYGSLFEQQARLWPDWLSCVLWGLSVCELWMLPSILEGMW